VRLNKTDVYKKSSEGDDFLTLFRTWAHYDDAMKSEKLNQAGGMGEWLSNEFGIEPGKAKRFQQVLRRPYWTALAIKHLEYAWGRETWLVQHFTDASAQGCDEV
jgi:hypothetical protein